MSEEERLEFLRTNVFVIGTNALFVDFNSRDDPIKGILEFIKFSPIKPTYHQNMYMIHKHFFNHCDDWLSFSCTYVEDSYLKIDESAHSVYAPFPG